MNRDLLEQPFDPAQIRQRQGPFGNRLDYVEGHAVIQRLNDALDGDWSFEVVEHGVLEQHDEILVLGRLSTGTVTKTQFGSSAITRAKETGEVVSLADDFKAAATDALKKCATQLGVGLYLYKNGNGQGKDPSVPARHNGNGNRVNGNGRLSPKQHSYILRLIGEAGITRNDFDRQCVERFGTSLDHLSRADASRIINQFVSQ